jgi:hypothetical protein
VFLAVVATPSVTVTPATARRREQGPPGPSLAAAERWIDLAALGLVMAVAALHLPLIFRINIGWDEFRFLSDVYAYRRGDLANALQTFHVHFFRWLPHIGGNEIHQVIAARGVFYLLLVGSSGFIYLIARAAMARAPALFAVLVFLSYSEVIGYGTTFRYDGLSVFLLLGSLALVVRRVRSPMAVMAAAGLAALALMVTIKSLFYLPTIGLVLIIGAAGEKWQEKVGRVLAFLGALVALSVTLFVIHNALLPAATVTDSVGMIHWVAPTGVRLVDPFPQAGYLLRGVVANLSTWMLFAAGILVLLIRYRNGSSSPQTLVPLALLIPLGSLVIYRNAFPYYYVFLMPVGAIVAAVPVADLVRTGESRARLAAATIVVAILLGFGMHYRDHFRDETGAQRQLVDTVHRMFPDPVAYVDPSSMIASFPKVGFFMSHWGLEHYHRTAQPIFEDLLLEHQPLFLLANYPLWLDEGDPDDQARRLLPADVKVLRDNYIQHWRTIHVAGKHLWAPDNEWTEAQIMIPGPYTVEAESPIRIDDGIYAPGDVVLLGQGPIRLRSVNGSVEVKLRWGEALYRPTDSPRAEPVFRGFYPCGSLMASCRKPSA